MSESMHVTHWPENEPPTREVLWQRMVAEGLSPYAWSNGPHDVYRAHSHDYDKVIYVVRGSIAFGLPAPDRRIVLKAGDRLELPGGTLHDAMVGPDGVVCLEGHR